MMEWSYRLRLTLGKPYRTNISTPLTPQHITFHNIHYHIIRHVSALYQFARPYVLSVLKSHLESPRNNLGQSMRRALLLFPILAVAMASPYGAVEAKTRQVGPTSFHKQIHIPNAMSNNNSLNNDESYSAPKHKKRQNRRQQRAREQRAAGEESRTQQSKASTQKRQGRRERQSNARQQRMQDRAEQFVTDKATNALND